MDSKIPNRVGCLLGLLLASTAVAQPPPQRDPIIAIQNVTVIPMTRGMARMRSPQTVLTQGGRIVSVGDVNTVTIPPSAKVIDGTGQFLIPGLIDAHSHVTFLTDPVFNPSELKLLVANGVTATRNLGGASEPERRALQGQIAARTLLGPRMLSTSQFITGPENRDTSGADYDWVCRPSVCIVKTAHGAIEVVRVQKDLGYTTLKVVEKMGREPLLALIQAAKLFEMDVVGHVTPDAVPIHEVLQKRFYRSIEHLSGYAEFVERKDSPFRKEPAWYRPFAILGVKFLFASSQRIEEIAKLTASSKTFNVPTLSTLRRYSQQIQGLGPDEIAGPGLEYMPVAWRELMAQIAADERSRLGYLSNVNGRNFAVEGYKANQSFVLSLHRAGAKIVAGSDHNAEYGVPGFSLHEELAQLVDAGLTPLEALRAATSNAAELLRRPDLGSIAPGQAADLVLLASNPLRDIRATRSITGVLAQGQWLDRDRLDALLAEVRAQANGPARAKTIDSTRDDIQTFLTRARFTE